MDDIAVGPDGAAFVYERKLPTVNLWDLEKIAIDQALEEAGSKKGAALLLGIARSALHDKIRRHAGLPGISAGRVRQNAHTHAPKQPEPVVKLHRPFNCDHHPSEAHAEGKLGCRFADRG